MIGSTYVIGLAGQARAGKDTTARHLINLIGEEKISRYAFADYLKKMYVEAQTAYIQATTAGNSVPMQKFFASLPLSPEQRDEVTAFFSQLFMRDINLAVDVFSEAKKSDHRPNLIALGLFMRSIEPDFWARYTYKQIEAEQPEFAVITDVRFENETSIADLVVRVVRPGLNLVYTRGQIDESERFALVGPYDELFDNQYDEETSDGITKIYNQLIEIVDRASQERRELFGWIRYKEVAQID